MDMTSPGVSVKPIKLISGFSPFCETFLSDVRVPVKNVVGKVNAGWTMAKALLGHERTMIAGVGETRRYINLLKRIAKETPVGAKTLMDDPQFRKRIAALEIKHRALMMANYRTLAAAQLGRAPGPESSILKLIGSELQQFAFEHMMDAMGHDALGWFDSDGGALPKHEQWVASQYNYLRATTIYGGSNEIQRNIIAKMILQLPGA